ncbi:MAG: hypothetical protein V7750_15680 [Sneathiella sp.]
MKLPFSLDHGAAGKAAIGVIVLQNDETLESEVSSVIGKSEGVLYHSRIPCAREVTSETLVQMEADLPYAASLLPSAREMDVVGYACTSGATVIGPKKIAAAIHQHHPNAKTTDPITAVKAACEFLGVTKLGFVSPYVADVSTAMQTLLEESGFTISAFGSFEQSEEAIVARISLQSVYDAICRVGELDDVEVVFASCTNLRSFEVIEKAEATTGKAVITSNQALAWHMLTLSGLPTLSMGPGRLFKAVGG